MGKYEKAPDGIEVVDVPTAARLLGIGRGLAYRLAGSGVLPTLKLGRRIVVPLRQLEAMLAGVATSAFDFDETRTHDNGSGATEPFATTPADEARGRLER